MLANTVPLVHQGTLLAKLKYIFPQEHIHENFTKNTNFTNAITGAGSEIDIWIPNLSLGFEFQDSYHYESAWYYNRPISEITLRDYSKQITARREGINLIVIPCWWQGDEKSLVASISFHYPGLVHSLEKETTSNPVPLNPTCDYFASNIIPGVGELMLASFLVESNSPFSFYSWWLGEKYDGIRACWLPALRSVYSRAGNSIPLLPSLLRTLPHVLLDSELWFGRGQYGNSYSLIKHSDALSPWHFLRMISFDVPSLQHHHLPFETRYMILLDHHVQSMFSVVAPRISCTTTTQVHTLAHDIIREGGEGVVVRKKGSRYVMGRSNQLLKLKTSQCDMEALVVGKGEQNSLLLKTPQGHTFAVPAADILIPPSSSLPLSIGTIVSFTFDNAARRDTPANPKVYRVRHDLSWNDVVRSALRDTQLTVQFSSRPVGHWTGANMRVVMMNIAKSKHLDPLTPTSWYSISSSEILKYKGGSAILQKHNGYYNALCNLFPEMKFDKRQFSTSLWNDVKKRRQVFEKYAKENGFNPLLPKNWYKQPSENIYKIKGIQSILRFHKRSIMQALVDLFPDIGIEKSKFRFAQLWREESNRRKFFIDYANSHGFDPFLPDNWTTAIIKNISGVKGVDGVIAHHKRSVNQALKDLFPSVAFDVPTFPSRHNTMERKQFDNFAKSEIFDFREPKNWYWESKQTITSYQAVA